MSKFCIDCGTDISLSALRCRPCASSVANSERVRRDAWTTAEDARLMRLMRTTTDRRLWAQAFPDRTPKAVKHRSIMFMREGVPVKRPEATLGRPRVFEIAPVETAQIVAQDIQVQSKALTGSDRLHQATMALFERTAERRGITPLQAKYNAQYGAAMAERVIAKAKKASHAHF